MKEMPHFDELVNKHLPRGQQKGSVEQSERPKSSEGSFSDLVPERAKEEISAQADRFREHQATIETMVHQGTPRHVAELRELGAPAIYSEDGKIVGVEAKEEQPTAEALVKSSIRPKLSPALKPSIRRQPGYDKRPEK